ncbi:hypothetical protein AAFF_G00306980 [Aldrovandia affinis]|uniref:Neurotransmitter-gated ion-channel ligand-binding domain-containing protein n=1 Tax=Aldrovandia affinis TaxID=143900 RepID=A0AAD7R7Y5_9TELE|nr:hypothetical protein AAFF_G00306980 [Aldrovandia affinis]
MFNCQRSCTLAPVANSTECELYSIRSAVLTPAPKHQGSTVRRHSHTHDMSWDGPKPTLRCLATSLRGVLLLSLISGTGSSNAPVVINRQGSPAPGEVPTPPSLSQWLESVLGGQSARLRPVRDWRTPVRVTVGFTVQNVLDMKEKQERLLLYILYRQVWQDERLCWDPVLQQGVRRVTVPAESIWVPDVVIYEMAGQEEPCRSTQVSVSHLGWVEQLQPRLLETSCPLDLFHFPLDYHTCNLTFLPQTHTLDEVEVHWSERSSSREGGGSFSMGEWEVVSLTAFSSPQLLPHLHTSAVRVQVTVRRRPLLYLVTLLLPSSLLLLLDLLGFLIPIHYKQRLSMKASVFTGHFIFITTVFTLFPPFTRDLPLIEVYLFGSLGLLACSTVETALVFQVASGRNEWVRKHIFSCLSGLWGRSQSQWEEPWITGCVLDESLVRTGAVDGCAAGGGQEGPLGSLLRDLAQVRRDLRERLKEQDRLSACRELASAIDHAYLYLHCLVLLTGGIVLRMQWR